ncbi:hypothetical protein, partial [Thiolapillus sp.]|uniref:hypothetical protein n=1 Tax=Thiolapillus sp. TaxID=2017437 RepID=UPI003AF431F7
MMTRDIKPGASKRISPPHTDQRAGMSSLDVGEGCLGTFNAHVNDIATFPIPESSGVSLVS